ncbi:hypothetical protein [Paraburkholderia acidisoli]|uniref:Chromosome partition protein Smc n=1 Tax=Paraburkholderia acidisoli TaxID=2571748 RepID=A0A7Z2JKY8_9BURK|nr:hypothetical protein [Paraburkholderia acidisoli]QGZ66980.1 hypothetical protein FAZ98_34665 [Paraburkholderia acidisoli]
MTDKNKPVSEKSFDPTVLEKGAVLPKEKESADIFGTHLPSNTEIAQAARETFGSTLNEDLLQELIRSSTEINESVRRILHEHLSLGFRFGEVMRILQRAYIEAYGDRPDTIERANKDAHKYIERLHRFSRTKIRMHLNSYTKFHANSEAVEFLRQTDMQMLLPKDLGDEIVSAVIAKRKADPSTSTREVKELIAAYRAKQDELAATREQVEAGNEEIARLTSLYDMSQVEEKRLQREMERMRLEQASKEEATNRLRNDLTLAGQSRSALHQQLSEMEKELAAVRREAADLKNNPPPATEDAEAKADLRRVNEQFSKLMKESAELEERIAAQKAEEAVLEAKIAEAEAAFEDRQKVEEQVKGLVIDFGEFAKRYTSTQLLCIAEGQPQRYTPIFEALADVVGKFHQEILAASKAA